MRKVEPQVCPIAAHCRAARLCPATSTKAFAGLCRWSPECGQIFGGVQGLVVPPLCPPLSSVPVLGTALGLPCLLRALTSCPGLEAPQVCPHLVRCLINVLRAQAHSEAGTKPPVFLKS